MNKKLLFTIAAVMCTLFLQAQEQNDSYLEEITKVVKSLRSGSNSVRSSAIETLSGDNKPKITLMDEIKLIGTESEKANEVKGTKGNRFKLNQVVAYVYKSQNNQLESKSNMLNGNETDINYSLIEKSVKKGGKVTYQLTGRHGKQDFVFVPYKEKTKYKISIGIEGGDIITIEVSDVYRISLPLVNKRNRILISIEYLNDKSNKDDVESFAILNYNPQK